MREFLEFTADAVIACEGVGDQAFLYNLIAKRALGIFQVQPVDGKNFEQFLTAVPVAGVVTRVLLVTDSDDAPDNTFERIQKQVLSADLSAPSAPLELSNGTPAVAILLIPWHDQPGNLESLCLPVMSEKFPAIAECVEEYFACANLSLWSVGKQAKMRFASLVAAACERDPTKAIQYLWGNEDYCMDSLHGHFDRIAEAIRAFGTA